MFAFELTLLIRKNFLEKLKILETLDLIKLYWTLKKKRRTLINFKNKFKRKKQFLSRKFLSISNRMKNTYEMSRKLLKEEEYIFPIFKECIALAITENDEFIFEI